MSAGAATWATHAERELAARGYRSGGARARVIATLGACGGCCTAAEIADQLRAGRERVATASVYRALATLQDEGLLHAVDAGSGERRYELVRPDGDHHHHLVCRGCGAHIPFRDEALEQAMHDVARRLGATVDAHDVTLHGRCRACGPG